MKAGRVPLKLASAAKSGVSGKKELNGVQSTELGSARIREFWDSNFRRMWVVHVAVRRAVDHGTSSIYLAQNRVGKRNQSRVFILHIYPTQILFIRITLITSLVLFLFFTF